MHRLQMPFKVGRAVEAQARAILKFAFVSSPKGGEQEMYWQGWYPLYSLLLGLAAGLL